MSFAAVSALRRRVDRATGLSTITGPRGMARVVERNARANRRYWLIVTSGLAEPLLYLFSIGVGVGTLVGELEMSGSGQQVPYKAFVAPALLATAAMNGAIADTTYNFYFKLERSRIYDAMLATPLGPRDVARGEATWAVLRSGLYGVCFLVVMTAMGLVESWWGLLTVPLAMLVGYAFAGAGMTATTFIRSMLDFDYIFLMITPLFLFSGTFFPLERYPGGAETIVQLTPLYQGVALSRALVLGDLHPGLLWNVLYLATMGTIGVQVASYRLHKLLRP